MLNHGWKMIVNPNAGIMKGQRDWPKILQILRDEKIDFTYELTTKQGDAITMAAMAIEEGYRNLAVIGGDGTMNEVLNGIFLQKAVPLSEITLGMIPVGTGNDW